VALVSTRAEPRPLNCQHICCQRDGEQALLTSPPSPLRPCRFGSTLK